VLARGGGLLAVLPGWHGVRADGTAYGHFVRVDPKTRVADVLCVESHPAPAPAPCERELRRERDPASARVLLRFKLGVDSEDPEACVGWVDAQRDFEGNLVLAWGSFNARTGGVARSYYMGLVEADAYPPGADPFRELDKDDVDVMFAARLEDAAAIDFRDHGNVLEAVVRDGDTTVVYHDTIIKELGGIELVAVWGTAHAFVGWALDTAERVPGETPNQNQNQNQNQTMRVSAWRGARRAGELKEEPLFSNLPILRTGFARQLLDKELDKELGKNKKDKHGAAPAPAPAPVSVSIAPWWSGTVTGGGTA